MGTYDVNNVTPLESLHIEGHLDGILTTVTITERFRNISGRSLDIRYILPVPDGAVPFGLKATVGGNSLTDIAVSKEQVGEGSKNSAEDGDLLPLIKPSERGPYTVYLENVANGEDFSFEFTYEQIPSFDYGLLTLRLSSSFAPCPDVRHTGGGLSAHQAIKTDKSAEEPVSLRLTLTGEAAEAELRHCSHPFAVRESHAGKEIVLHSEAMLERDYVFVFDGLDRNGI